MNIVLKIAKGSAQDVAVTLVDDNGKDESMASFTSAHVHVKSNLTDADANDVMSIACALTSNGVTFTISNVVSNVAVGTYIARIVLTGPGGTYFANPFYVEVTP